MIGAWSMATAAYLFTLPSWLPPLLVDLEAADLLVRAGFCVLVLAPAGFLMGFGFSTGMRLVTAAVPPLSSKPTCAASCERRRRRAWLWMLRYEATGEAVIIHINPTGDEKPLDQRRGIIL